MNNGLSVIGEWSSLEGVAHLTDKSLPAAIAAFRSPAFVVRDGPSGRVGVGVGGGFAPDSAGGGGHLNGSGYPCLGILPALYPEWLGDRAFLERHGLRFPYVAGAMARGIASEAQTLSLIHI